MTVAVQKVDVTCLREPRMLRGKLREAIRMFVSLNGRDCFVTSFFATTIFFFLDKLSFLSTHVQEVLYAASPFGKCILF